MTIIVVEYAIYIILFFVWLFFLVHAVQRIENPIMRFAWVGWFLLFNIICPVIYIATKYRQYLRLGQGGLIIGKKNKIKKINK